MVLSAILSVCAADWSHTVRHVQVDWIGLMTRLDSTCLDLTRQSQSWQTSNQLESPSQSSVLNTFKLDVAHHAGPASGKLAAMRNITCASVTPKNGAKRYKCASMFLSKSLCHKVNLVGSIIVGCIRVSQQVLKSIRPCLVGDNNGLVRPQ